MAYEKTQQARINLGLCKDCGADRGNDGTTVFCRPCAKTHAIRSANRVKRLRSLRKDKNCCNQCGKQKEKIDTKLCDSCKEIGRRSFNKRSSERRREHPILGLCLDCKNPVFGESKYCKKHWLESFSFKYKLNADDLFLKLEQQEYRCAFTGKTLIPGDNACIDHLTPRSIDPEKESDIDNVVWCDKRINLMKGNMTYKEFIDTCAIVAVLACGETVIPVSAKVGIGSTR